MTDITPTPARVTAGADAAPRACNRGRGRAVAPTVADPEDAARRDDALVAAWRRGDVEAFEEVVRLHRRRLFAIALRHAGGVEAAEDAVQVALWRAWNGIRRVNGHINLSAWLGTIVENAAHDQTRDASRHRRLAARAEAATPRASPTTQHGAGAGARQELLELGRILHDGIAALPDPYRRPLELYHVHGLPVSEVARALDTNVNTVKSHLARGRGMLHRALEERLRNGGYL